MSDKFRSLFAGVPWPRLFIEGGVIVFSILLAFAIDAWWEQSQDRELEIQQLARVSAELMLNDESFRSKIDDLKGAFDAAVEHQSRMGVNPEPVDPKELMEVWDRILGIGTLSVPNRAINEYLAAASQGDPQFSEIRDRLTEWSYRSERVENQYVILRQKHAALTEHLISMRDMPALSTLPDWMIAAGMPESAFPADPSGLLKDPLVENLLADYMIRLLFVFNMLEQQLQRQEELIQLIDDTAAS